MGMENQHYQYRQGLLDQDAYSGFETTIREQIAAFPGTRAMWKLVRHSYGGEFAEFMDQQVAAAPTHQESTLKKWKEIVATQATLGAN